jgi:hypothetical protein
LSLTQVWLVVIRWNNDNIQEYILPYLLLLMNPPKATNGIIR